MQTDTYKTAAIQTVKLASGYAMPMLGLGTYKAHNTIDLMLKALDLGYRALDTAWMYQNEAEVGQALSLIHI